MFDWGGTSDDNYCDGSCWDSASCTCTPPDDDNIWGGGW